MSAFPPDLFAGKCFAVVGLGRNGLAVARALLAMGADVTPWDDSSPARAAAADVPLRDPCQGPFAFDALVLSPGIPHLLPKPHPAAERARAANVPILSDAELLFQAVRCAGSRARFVGITGTNGKSTTTALLAHILACAGVPVAAGGNLGTASLALPLLPNDGIYVLEMSSYMLERLATLRFDAAAMLNLSPDHLDRHGDIAGYAAAKRAIFDRQQPGDLAVVGVDDAGSRAMAAWLRTRPAMVVTVSGQIGDEAATDRPRFREEATEPASRFKEDAAKAGPELRSPPPLEGGGRGEGSVQTPSQRASLLTHARSMRHDPTPAERKLWKALRKRQTGGLKFRRQMPVGPFIADFYCAAAKIVVELDGISHIDSQTDAARDAWMQQKGIRVVRFSNHEVLSNVEGVCLAIEAIARETPPPNPLPQGEGEYPSPLAITPTNAPALPGAHNAQNAAAAYAMARFLGVPHDTIAHAMSTFPGLPHRQQRLRTIDGITFVNDSKATNADAAACALSCYDRVVWIAGGLAKQGGIEPLAPFFPRIAHALLIGRDAPMLAATLQAHNVPHEIASTLETATSRAFTAARTHATPVVLLSPACASFDQFTGFDARGQKFADLVASLAQERAA